jgi:hypothetical protein
MPEHVRHGPAETESDDPSAEPRDWIDELYLELGGEG